MEKQPIIISVCGKGGVGKTSISSLLISILSRDKSKRVLSIDADPAVGLATSLGFTVDKTVDDIRNDIICRYEAGEKKEKKEMICEMDYELFGALQEKDNIGFLAIGRPETEGCYCKINSFLKDIIRDLACHYDYVIIDAEAGIEQVNRRVMELVTHLLLVTDVSLKSRNVVETIANVAKKTIGFNKNGVLFNKVNISEDVKRISDKVNLPVLGFIPENDLIADFDIEGRSFFEMPETEAVKSLKDCMQNFIA